MAGWLAGFLADRKSAGGQVARAYGHLTADDQYSNLFHINSCHSVHSPSQLLPLGASVTLLRPARRQLTRLPPRIHHFASFGLYAGAELMQRCLCLHPETLRPKRMTHLASLMVPLLVMSSWT